MQKSIDILSETGLLILVGYTSPTSVASGNSSLQGRKAEKVLQKAIAGILVAAAIGAGVWYFYRQVAHTPIRNLVENPRDYEGKVLTLEGEVTSRASLFVVKYFTLKDHTGEIKVVTVRFLPPVGSKVRVRGKIEEAFSIGNLQTLVFVEEYVDKEER